MPSAIPKGYYAQIAQYRCTATGKYTGWRDTISTIPFCAPEGAVRHATALYSEEDLALAVAAERERCLGPIIEMSQKWDDGISDDLRSVVQTIRSATK